MRYLVTGGAGFLGTNLCLRLLSEGNSVVAVDNLSTARKENLELLKSRENFSFTKHDIVNPLPDLGEFDFIYNLACPASPVHYQKDPIQTFRTSVWGLWNVLQYAKENRTPVLQASTSEVYGDPNPSPQNESYFGNVNPIGPRSCYDEGKRAAESLMTDFSKRHSHPVKIVRIFNTYGPYMDQNDGRLVSNLILQALSDKPLTIYGKGTQTRSLCYADDLIEGLVRIEKTSPDFTVPVNLGSSFEISVNGLADLLESILGKKLPRRHLDLPADDPKQRLPDVSLARTALGWEARTSLEDGLRKTIEYFRSTRV